MCAVHRRCPREEEKGEALSAWREGMGGMCGVWRLAALATVGGDIRRLFSPVGGGSNNKRTNTSTGTRPKRKARHTHTGQPEHTGEGARSPLCCRFTWGVWLVVVVGRQTRVWVATYVRVSTIGRYRLKYLCCLRQCSSQAHMCEILP